jgi:hypothetical protein
MFTHVGNVLDLIEKEKKKCEMLECTDYELVPGLASSKPGEGADISCFNNK